jgi:uncharacterized protein
MQYLGFFIAILIGISLGLIGGGGSIFTVPLLVYLFRLEPAIATTYSLFIVGLTSAVGSVNYLKAKLVNVKTIFIFGIPSIISVFIMRFFVVPIIPNEIFSINGFLVTKNILTMILFAFLMLVASYCMIKKDRTTLENESTTLNYPLLTSQGLLVGMVTGLIGAGGGFLIIPSLIHFGKLKMKVAVGTSLVIISINSLIGFLSENDKPLIDWKFLFSISVFAILGIFIGMGISKRINSEKLKPIFGYFVLIMGVYIFIKEFFLK